YRVSRHTIRAVRKREADSITQFQIRLAFKCSLIAEAAMDQIREALETNKVSIPHLVMIANKSIDLFLKLTRDIAPPVQSTYDIPYRQPSTGYRTAALLGECKPPRAARQTNECGGRAETR